LLPTLITLSRFPLLAVAVGAMYSASQTLQFTGIGVLLAGLVLDTMDGVVARRRHETSLLGSVLDIAADRTYEVVLWICFADLGVIPLLIPVIVVARTALTDAIRGLGVRRGTAPFAQLETRLGAFLVASAWMRTAYGLTKLLAFCGLAAVRPLGASWPEPAAALLGVMQPVAWLCVTLCVLRGVPVVIEGFQQHRLAPDHARRM
jgi:phosphatidylglycerophosphate synthase